ncbi:uncharacterized protein PHACADRAFT_165338 [Phanerochaete carnosa HHB-10118-sp]|uniref:Peroxin domain-containing protein n=1 Tax=Phanerochaete carnosa (strain HHB-10118-sp) TaxID=650164 RepID=K5WNV4_PHACS|nr:uncharacterized protein PHACADRAFT_165338 [Phanerochaete carnosa HHB-10118-sp]EKM52002.1 hypothetical protein PHACADRAFT_165338 [Phanerochaete carnosa HHB-10118-sp]
MLGHSPCLPCMADKHWCSELREVELWENERWAGRHKDASWSKDNWQPDKQKAWTRGRDSWSSVSNNGSENVSSNLTFSLLPRWLFVEMEDWRPDSEAFWIECKHADQDGWVYTDNVWMHPSSAFRDSWKQSSSMTRRQQ